MAHEAAHEYVWEEWQRADKRDDWKRLRELELVCDGIAVVILQQLGLETSSLIRGFEKLTYLNLLWLGSPRNPSRYPTLAERSEFARKVAAWMTGRSRKGASGRAGLLQPPLSTLEALLASDPNAFAEWLNTSRPAPLAPATKRRILDTLPPEGEVTALSDDGRLKLEALRPLLRAVEREGVYEVKVVDSPLARIGLYERTVLLITETALNLLTAADLQALVAHEIGHEYVADDYERAAATGDRRRLKDLELLCDAIGIATLLELRMDPSRLISGVDTITGYNRAKFGAGIDERAYPTMGERRQFARAVTAWLETAKREDNTCAHELQQQRRHVSRFLSRIPLYE